MNPGIIVLIVVICYLGLLLGLGLFSGKLFRGTSKDYFVASHSIGPFLLLMSVFGTTMTAFALVGSTGKAFERGIGTYGLMASISGLIHAALFFVIGVRVWSHGYRQGFVTQIQLFRARFESNGIGYLLFPILVGLVIPYLLIGIIGAAKTIQPVTAGAFPGLFEHPSPLMDGGIPPWLTGLVVCAVVLTYVFAGGSRGAAWANTFQTLVFMGMGVVAFIFITNSLGGLENADKVVARVTDKGTVVQEYGVNPETKMVEKLDSPKVVGKLVHEDEIAEFAGKQPHLMRAPVEVEYKKKNPVTGEVVTAEKPREVGIPFITFVTYLFIPLSVGMFPHLFQHWLTAKRAKSFRLTVIAHPLCIMIVWVPCVLIGTWATGILPWGLPEAAVLSNMLRLLVDNAFLTGLLTAGILAAIMSSLDSQFLCLGTMFTNDIVLKAFGKDKFNDRQIVLIARFFIVAIVTLIYIIAMNSLDANVFDLAVWSFAGFGSLTPLVICALYWKGATKAGAYACVLAAFGVWLFFFWQSGWGGEYTVLGGIQPAALSFTAGLVAMIGVSSVTKKPSEETIRKFFPDSK
ncbi:MAG: sodium:solute symporter family protein [Verrucomicrobiota bacterium]